ncbi:NACHT domain-containing protein [Methylomonas koyamae]|uniref:NACHT domain-containing protein n=1 Tax=Methylomonas koyamae TaxID=702114 RepID=UPI00112D7C03|nr:hypothetical protein [Methylomonas koyamae]TPQ25652.1 hypothetical protein C2U68_14810 [Methylomonas koyamae]
MLYRVSRTVTEKAADDSPAESRTIADYRDRPAYVLLGEPGAGKSTLFEHEAKLTGGYYISARDFIDLDSEEWRETTLFIDGLDEARAGNDHARTPLGAIRGKLNKLACKRFRISCREADWLGGLDNKDLAKVSPSQEITHLYLDPLSIGDVTAILANDDRVGDADGFIDKTQRFGLSGLLDNPQTLDMLIDAVKGGREWPKTKQEIYRLAVEQLAVEFNDEHGVAEKSPVLIPALLDMAGTLCAIQLLANLSGFSEGYPQRGRVSLVSLDLPPATQAALKTRLFRKVGDEYSYVHRSIAEYLAAYFIAGKIKQGLLVNRVLALTTGVDGGIVAALRGLMAWLAVLSEPARDRLIEIDPLGVVLYGDVQLFSTASKVKLLNALKVEVTKTSYSRYEWDERSFAAITTRDMAPYLFELFNNPSREQPEQSVLDCVLDGLYHGEVIEELKPSLLAAIRDSSYWEGIRVRALQAFMHQYPQDSSNLLALAEEIRQNKIEDNKRLLGLLLYKLFPDFIPARDILQYLKPIRNHNLVSHYDIFWRSEFSKRVADEDLPIVLDKLAGLGVNLLKISPVQDLFSMAGELLVRGVNTHGVFIPTERLYSWLCIGQHDYHSKLRSEHKKKIREWLEKQPTIYLSLFEFGILQIDKGTNNISSEWYKKIRSRFYDATPPNTFGVWSLAKAENCDDFKIGCELVRQAFTALIDERSHHGLSLEYFQGWISQHDQFCNFYESLILNPIEDWQYEHAQSENHWENEQKKQLKERLDFFKKHKTEITGGGAHPHVFHNLASAYFDHFSGINGSTGEQRLSDFLNNDTELIQAAKIGLRKILDRRDLPELDEIFALALEGCEHYIRLPFLVCMEKLYQETPSILFNLTPDLISKALAFWYTYGCGDEPAWVKPLSLLNEELTAKVLIAYVGAMLAGKKQHIHGLYQLAHDEAYKEIVKLSVIPVFNKYPIRATAQQSSHLECLLKAAINWLDKNELMVLIDKKLACKGMDVAQRVYWLITGLIIRPEKYQDLFKKELYGKATRINHLSAFLCPSWKIRNETYALPASAVGLLIEMFGPRCSPRMETGAHFVGRAENERDYVRYSLDLLASDPSESSTEVLYSLSTQSKLAAWHSLIRDAHQTQQISRREALFKHPDASQVIETLNNQKPANVADLAVLVFDCLQQLAEEMHGGSTNRYQNFWNLKGKEALSPKEPYSEEDPRYEEVGRNYLVDLLKPMLTKYAVAVEPEALQANEKRADIKLSFIHEGRSYFLPIEIKRDYHRELWKTIHQQLIPRYTISPETEGRGLYLVLWFNFKKLPTHPQGLPPPKSASELEEMLEATLTRAERKLIDVFVLDVSAYTGPSR